MGAILPLGEYLDIKVSSHRKAGSVKSKQVLKRQTAKVGNAEAKAPRDPALPLVPAALHPAGLALSSLRLFLTASCADRRALPGRLGEELSVLE